MLSICFFGISDIGHRLSGYWISNIACKGNEKFAIEQILELKSFKVDEDLMQKSDF